jgi:peptide-methionine (S)-S-oxide reductase
MEYDPDIVSYEQLMAAFWAGHDASYSSDSTQYRSAIFYTGEQQQKTAIASKKAEEARLGKKLYTDIEQTTGFYIAEDYHQKYYLRQTPDVVQNIYAIYPDPDDFRDSTAAARLNGYLGAYGNKDALKNSLDSLGLSDSGKRALLQITANGLTPGCPIIAPQ